MLNRISSKNIFLALCMAVAAIGCSKDETSPTETDNTTITAPYYAQATINGKVTTWQADPFSSTNLTDISMGFTGGGSGTSQGEYYTYNGFQFQRYKFVGGKPEEEISTPRITIQFGKTYPNGEPYMEEVESLITMGTMQYGGLEMKKDGVEIMYRDTQGKQWTTSAGTADQTGSSFAVTEHTRVASGLPNDQTRFKTKVTFNCKVYDGSGNSLTITNGKALGRTIKYYY